MSVWLIGFGLLALDLATRWINLRRSLSQEGEIRRLTLENLQLRLEMLETIALNERLANELELRTSKHDAIG